MNSEEERKAKFWNKIFLILAFFLPLCSAVLARHFMIYSGGEIGYDPFYHMGIAKLGPSVILGKEFPWLEASIWKSTFADKEMLYHLSLFLILKVQNFLGFAAEPPFHFAAFCYLIFLCGSFVFAGVRFRVPPALLCAGSLLFALSTPTWTFRMCMLRPHIVSIGYFFLICGVLAGGTLKSRMILTAVISFLYAWTYSNPHFIVIPVLVFAIFSLGRGTKKVLFLPLISLSAVLFGLLIHPQFPNSFTIWKLQSWDALLTPMLEDSLLSKPMEMQSPAFTWLMFVLPHFVITYFTVLYLVRLTERHGWKGVDSSIYALAFLSWMFTFGIFLAMRSVEYAAPLTALLFLVLVARAHEDGLLNPFRRFGVKVQLIMLFLMSLSLGCHTASRTIRDGRNSFSRLPLGIAAWMDKNLEKDEPVINLDWSDFPMLFYVSSRQHYQWGMDPVFSFAVQPEKAVFLSSTRNPGKIPRFTGRIKSTFGCRYAVLLYPRIQHASVLTQNGWKLKKEILSLDGNRVEGWIFALDEQEANSIPHTLIR